MIRRWGVVGLAAMAFSLSAVAEDWEVAREDSARLIRVYTRARDVSDYDEFRAEMRVPQPPATVVAVLSDLNAWPEWIARIRKVKRLRHEGDSNWVYVVYKLPYPFKERDTVLRSTLSREKSGVTVVRSVAVRQEPMPEQGVKRVHLYDLESVWRLTPLPDGGTKIELSGRGDPGGLMPSLFFNYNLADEPLQTLRLLRVMLGREKYAAKAGGGR